MDPVLLPNEDVRKIDEIGPPIRVVGLTKSVNEPLVCLYIISLYIGVIGGDCCFYFCHCRFYFCHCH